MSYLLIKEVNKLKVA